MNIVTKEQALRVFSDLWRSGGRVSSIPPCVPSVRWMEGAATIAAALREAVGEEGDARRPGLYLPA